MCPNKVALAQSDITEQYPNDIIQCIRHGGNAEGMGTMGKGKVLKVRSARLRNMASSSSSTAPFDIFSVVQSVPKTAAETDVLSIVANTKEQKDDDVDVMSIVASATSGKRKKDTKTQKTSGRPEGYHKIKGSAAAKAHCKKMRRKKRQQVR